MNALMLKIFLFTFGMMTVMLTQVSIWISLVQDDSTMLIGKVIGIISISLAAIAVAAIPNKKEEFVEDKYLVDIDHLFDSDFEDLHDSST